MRARGSDDGVTVEKSMKTAINASVLLDVLAADKQFGGASREALRSAYDSGCSHRM